MFIDFLKREWKISCLGCAIANGIIEPPYGLIYQSNHLVVHQDPLVPLKGFIILASKRHIKSINQMTSDEYREYCDLVKKIRASYPESDNFEGLTFIQEEISSHFHIWFFPWYTGMRQKEIPALNQIRDLSEKYCHIGSSIQNLREIEEFVLLLQTRLNE